MKKKIAIIHQGRFVYDIIIGGTRLLPALRSDDKHGADTMEKILAAQGYTVKRTGNGKKDYEEDKK